MALDGDVGTVRRADVTLDVGGGHRVAAAVAQPSGADDGSPRVVLFGFPGGGLSRGYFDVQLAGDDSYSQAAFHAERGWIVVSCDHLGVGDSSQPDPATLTYARLAEANDVAVRSALTRLAAGNLVEGLGPVTVRGSIGMGHSMGGCITIVQQGNHDTFDALAVLGFSALQTTIPVPGGVLDIELKERDDASASLDAGIAEAGGVDMFRWAFYWEDVPSALVEADMGSGYPRTGSSPVWGSPTTPPVVFSMMSPGVVSAEAAAVTSPVLLAVGERDVVPDLRAEAPAYRASKDITLVEIPAMAHMHNLAGTRRSLWERLHAWGEYAVTEVTN